MTTVETSTRRLIVKVCIVFCIIQFWNIWRFSVLWRNTVAENPSHSLWMSGFLFIVGFLRERIHSEWQILLEESEQSHRVLRPGRVIMSSGHYAITVDLTRPAQNETAALRGVMRAEFSAPLNDLGNIIIVGTRRLSHTARYKHSLKPADTTSCVCEFCQKWFFIGWKIHFYDKPHIVSTIKAVP